MYFGLSEDQTFFQENIIKYLNDACPLDNLRKIADGDKDLAAEINLGLVNLGVNAIMIPEEYGGLGLDLLFAAAVSQGLGYGLSPTPFVGSYVMAPIAILEAGNEEQKKKYLPKIADNSLNFGVCVSPFTGARDNAKIKIAQNKVSGNALFAIDIANPSHVLLADEKGLLGIVEIANNNVTINTLTTIDKTRAVAELIFENARLDILEKSSQSKDIIKGVLDAGRIVLAADTIGASQNMIDQAVAYAQERKQFGRAIGTFQAVKHMCAEMAAELEPCYSLVWHAAHLYADNTTEGKIMASHAKSHTSEVGKMISKTAIEVHGGMGFTDLLGLHFWFKRIGFNRQLFGSPEQLREEAALLQFN